MQLYDYLNSLLVLLVASSLLIPSQSLIMGYNTVADAQVKEEVCTDTSNSKETISAIVDNIFDLLSDDEKEKTAKASSYRYLKNPKPNDRDRQAKTQIERYVVVEEKLGNSKSAKEVAYNKLKKTIEYREEQQIDDIRLCFDKNKLSNKNKLHANLRQIIEDRFSTGASFIRGYTKDGEALFINLPRADTHWEEEGYIKGNIYTLERGLACTERRSNGAKSKVIAFYDYNGYRLENSPPPLLVKELLSVLRDHYPERLVHVFVVDAPFLFRAFWNIIKHFIDPITKELVQFVTGEDQKQIFKDMISEDQASNFHFNGAQNTDDVDMKSYFYDTPFDRAYGEK